MSHEPHHARERLLNAAVDYVAEHGVTDLSLRSLATAIHTSHRMLIYHFGSKQGLLVEVVRAVEERQREFLTALDVEGGGTLADLSRALFERLADPAMWPTARLFFEMYGQALQHRPGTADLLDSAVTPWLSQGEDLVRRHGIDGDAAPAHARLALAATRGLLLDLLTTQDVDGARAAAEYFIALWQHRTDGGTAEHRTDQDRTAQNRADQDRTAQSGTVS